MQRFTLGVGFGDRSGNSCHYLQIFVFMHFQGSSHETLQDFCYSVKVKAPLSLLEFSSFLSSLLPFFRSLQLANQLTNYFLANFSIFFISSLP